MQAVLCSIDSKTGAANTHRSFSLGLFKKGKFAISSEMVSEYIT